ncbi:MAG: Stage IV sporulation protein FB [Firmicutes bacterium ADurb.Bin506]|nr:MAG: Stage IV sporulation protein FB [Firmicutes bacterium ADurb.Bin506]
MNGGSAIARVSVDPAVFVMALLIVLAGMVAEWAMVMACVVAHELAHAAAASGFGMRVEEIRISALGASVRVESGSELRPEVEAVVAMAGPMASLVMATVGVILWGEGAELFTGANIGLAMFNLLPAFPLDGGRILRAIAASHMGWRGATRMAVAVSRCVAAAIIIAGGVGLVLGKLNLLPAALGVFVWIEAAREGRWAALAPARQGLRARAALAHGDTLPVRSLAVGARACAAKVLSSLGTSGVTMVSVLSPDGVELGRLSQIQLIDGVAELGSEATVAQVLGLRCYGSVDKQGAAVQARPAGRDVSGEVYRQ